MLFLFSFCAMAVRLCLVTDEPKTRTKNLLRQRGNVRAFFRVKLGQSLQLSVLFILELQYAYYTGFPLRLEDKSGEKSGDFE